MGKKDKNKKKGKGAEKTSLKTDKKIQAKQKKILEKLGEADIVEVVAKLEAEEARRTTVIESVCPPPTPRTNFAICAHPDKEEIIIFGGEFYNGQTVTLYNEMYFYNIPKNEWKSVKSPAGPAPRSSHQMVSVANDGGQLWIFGGEHPSPSQMQFYHHKDLWVYRLTDKKWEKVTGPVGWAIGPSPRSGHRMIAIKKKLFVFGGFYDSGLSYKYFNDMWMFSMESYTWQEIQTTGVVKPLPRSAGCMAATPDGKILVWGGYSRTTVKKEVDRGITHPDMFALVPDKNDTKGLTWKWTSVKPGGFKPAPRSGVILTTAPNGNGYIFGGVLDTNEDEENLEGNFSNEMHSLDLTTQVWRLQELKQHKAKKAGKKAKSDKAGGSDEVMDDEESDDRATVSTDGVFTMVIGGGSSSEIASKVDSKGALVAANNIPSPRMKVGLVVVKGTLYLYGGVREEGDKQYTLADFYSLDLHKMDAWKTIIGSDLIKHEWMDSDDSDSDDSDDDGSDDDDDDNSDDSSDEMDTE